MLKSFIHFSTAVALGCCAVLAAQTQTPAPAAIATTATLRGHITDPTGALIPGATVTVSSAAGKQAATVTSDATGHFVMSDLAPGSYSLVVG